MAITMIFVKLLPKLPLFRSFAYFLKKKFCFSNFMIFDNLFNGLIFFKKMYSLLEFVKSETTYNYPFVNKKFDLSYFLIKYILSLNDN